MTIWKSTIISLFLHAALLGSGLSLARYGEGPSSASFEFMTVALIEQGAPSEGSSDLAATDRLSGKKASDAVHPDPAALQPSAQNRPDVRKESSSAGADAMSKAWSGGKGSDPGLEAPSETLSREHWASLVSAIEREKRYPRLARERGIQGEVRLRFRIKRRGEVDAVEIVKSSGHAVLDHASIRTVYRSAPFPFVTGWVELPITYVLK